jgi:CubicO group peptidase (beta-lactamase class C family)
VAAAQATGQVPTLVAAVVRKGTVVHLTGAGAGAGADAGKGNGNGAGTGAGTGAGAGLDPQLQFRIGSITKTMTAALVLQLRDAGLLALDDLLYRHLPGTPVGGVTLRQLLSHVSGLRREPAGQWWERNAGVELDTLLDGVSPDTLAHPPYRHHHYSNLAYGLLGAVLHRATGESWAALLERRLRKPLGLTRTTYHPEEPFARGYVVHPWYGTLREEPRHDSLAMAPAGQLWSTLADLSRWAAFLASPNPDVLAPDSVAEMCNPVAISDPDSWTAGYGLGTALWRVGERIYIGHTGSMPGYLAVLVVHRASGTGVVAFANGYTLRGGGIERLGTRLLTAVLEREPDLPAPWRPAAAPPAEVAPLCGRWWWMGVEFQAGWDGTELVFASLADPGAPTRFTQDGADRWRGTAGPNAGELLAVRRDTDGAVEALDIATLVYTRSPGPAT